jgi:hypothetical protein
MRKEPKALTFDEFADELLKEKQPRALVILAAAKIDTQLQSLLEKILLPKAAKPNETDELLESDNPLATLSAKTKICRRLGVLDPAMTGILDRLRAIRNQAAHWVTFGLSDAPLREQCRDLRDLIQSRKSYRLTVARFFGYTDLNEVESLQATLLTVAVLIEGVYQKVKRGAVGKAFKLPKLD